MCNFRWRILKQIYGNNLNNIISRIYYIITMYYIYINKCYEILREIMKKKIQKYEKIVFGRHILKYYMLCDILMLLYIFTFLI